jgi:hypothetical protein
VMTTPLPASVPNVANDIVVSLVPRACKTRKSAGQRLTEIAIPVIHSRTG